MRSIQNTKWTPNKAVNRRRKKRVETNPEMTDGNDQGAKAFMTCPSLLHLFLSFLVSPSSWSKSSIPETVLRINGLSCTGAMLKPIPFLLPLRLLLPCLHLHSFPVRFSKFTLCHFPKLLLFLSPLFYSVSKGQSKKSFYTLALAQVPNTNPHLVQCAHRLVFWSLSTSEFLLTSEILSLLASPF